MKSLSREAIQRMFNGESVCAGGGGNFDPSMISGLAQQSWVEENFVSIEFFGRLFKAYGPGENEGDPDVEVLPNDMDSTISNIEAMFGFWTDFYLTALGNGGEISASVYLAGLADVNVEGVQTGQVLTWKLDPVDNQYKWMATTPSSGVDMNQVWNALAAQTSQQINASHLTNALTGYATQTWVGQQGFATTAWVNNNFVTPTVLATEMAKKVDVSFFDEIFQVFNNNTKIAVNGTLPSDKSKMNIKAMFGFWTNFYVTALGNGGEIGASIYLAGLKDVNVEGVQSGQVLTWKLDPVDNQYKWMATTPSSGVDMNQVWNALAAQTSQQINASHLSTALTGYATETWVGQQGYITSAALSGYATQTWVGQQGFLTASDLTGYATESWVETHGDGRYLKLTGGELTGMLKVTGAPIFGYVYSASNNRAAFIFDKPGSNYTGIGANAVSDQIYFGACDANGEWVSYKQKWLFNGDLSCDDISCDDIGCGDINATGDVTASGNGTFANVLSNGYVTALSDQREKNIIENFEVSLKYIADAPVVSYTWKDTERRGDKQHIGSIAQYWLREMPELVPEVNGRYTMDYGRIALLSAILTARHVVNLEQRIAELEKTLRGE